ncbi:hypothetical protein M407DRAFT_245185 [Tulasnella calospora MUT 4182]|uniref:Uncharacterized protein n=1 Tax=Tulasnella calospora MUT 4182 TaxID=1051891 RepID=A0A0C3LM67_9AGAM|nr:hypothetical protein M407DRAFT_245185 [Tulasnella calospora MUT 4182]
MIQSCYSVERSLPRLTSSPGWSKCEAFSRIWTPIARYGHLHTWGQLRLIGPMCGEVSTLLEGQSLTRANTLCERKQ